MRVNLSIEVPGSGNAGNANALRALLASAFTRGAQAAVPMPPLQSDRIERGGPAALGDPLRELAARRTAAPATGYVRHGALRVPRSAERAFRTAARYLERDAVMRHVFERIEHSRTEYTLRVVHNGDDRYEPDSHTVVWDPYSALRTSGGGRQTPALGLGHELAHAAASPARFDAGYAHRLRAYDNGEERRVIRGAELHAARTLGEAARTDHRGTCYRVASPIAC